MCSAVAPRSKHVSFPILSGPVLRRWCRATKTTRNHRRGWTIQMINFKCGIKHFDIFAKIKTLQISLRQDHNESHKKNN
jgi:hypothetical protein